MIHDVDFVYMVIKEAVAFVKYFILSNLSEVLFMFF